ncbi:MAG: SDR family oxidoreductase [Promethearchaeota archaeon]|nr:MAG: SDR family oxidoreductase [Candidatus Lokiarchaeota archaeon]
MKESFLENKGVVITGGASGFGRGAAFALAERGAEIVLVDFNKELLDETAEKVREKTGTNVIPILCDVSKSDQVKSMAKKAQKELPNVYILFNNAGIGVAYGKNICRVKEKDWDRIMDINLKGQWLVAKAFWRIMKSQKFEGEDLSGKIINTSSTAGLILDPNLPTYSITKAAINSLTILLAKSLAPNISVNSIAPGFHVTGIYLNDEETMRVTMRYGKIKIPLQRIGTVQDVVDLVIFLSSPSSDYITGSCIPIDGGLFNIGRKHGLKWEDIEY